MNPTQTKQQLFLLLSTGHTVTVRWDCGGDESFVYTSVDGQEVPARYDGGEDFAYGVEQVVTDTLNLPSAGEFSMTGNGQFYHENRSVGLAYTSDAGVYEEDLDDDFYDTFTDEQLADMGLERPHPRPEPAQEPKQAEDEDDEAPKRLRDEGMSQEYSGRRILFHLPNAAL